MEVVAAIGAGALGSLPSSSNPFPDFSLDRFLGAKTNITRMVELGSCLSPNAPILLPGSDRLVRMCDAYFMMQMEVPSFTIM